MAEKSVIVIGAGLAGLSAGCYLQMNGYRSQIFEHHTVPGGVAACWRREGYLIDGGIHFLMGYQPGSKAYEVYEQLGAIQPDLCAEMESYGRFTDVATGRSLELTKDFDRFIAQCRAISPDDVHVIEEIVAGARGMQGHDLTGFGLAKPPELFGRLDQMRDLWEMRSILKYFSGKYAKPVVEYTAGMKDAWLKTVVRNLFLPTVPMAFLSMLFALFADGQMGFLKRGCLDFVRSIERKFKELGGSVQYGATVEKIIVENNKAVGVRLADGSEHRVDAVVSAGDGYSTIFEMLGGRYVSDKLRNYYANWPRFKPLLTISYGIAREYSEIPPFSVLWLDKPLEIAGEEVPALMLRTLNYSPHFAPVGKTVLQVEFETSFDYWNDLQATDRPAYDEAKRKGAERVLEHLDRAYPGTKERVEMTDVATPYTLWRYTRNDRGSWEGWLLNETAFKTQILRTLPGLDNFYMAGQWVMPGGGVPPVLMSGRHVAQLMCKEDRKRFVASA
jgi:phytoene desaturase